MPKITPACYFYARLKILLQNSLHVSLMRPRKKITKIISQCLCPAHYYKKKLPKTAGKSTESLYNIHTVFYYSRKNQIIEPTILYAISIYILYWSLLYTLFSIWETFYCFLGDIMGEILIKVFVPKLKVALKLISS